MIYNHLALSSRKLKKMSPTVEYQSQRLSEKAASADLSAFSPNPTYFLMKASAGPVAVLSQCGSKQQGGKAMEIKAVWGKTYTLLGFMSSEISQCLH